MIAEQPPRVPGGGLSRWRWLPPTRLRLAAALLLVLCFLVADVDSAVRVLKAPAGLTATHAGAVVLAYGLAAAAMAVFAALAPARIRWLTLLPPALLLFTVLVATATAGGKATSMAAAFLAMAALWFVGRRLLLLLRAHALAQHALVAWLAGAGPLCLLTLLLGRLSLFKWWTMGLLVVVLGLLATADALRLLWPRRQTLFAEVTATPLAVTAAGLILLTLSVAAIYTSAPELQYDALYGKQYLPSLWAYTGTIGPLTRHIQLNIGGWFQFVASWGDLLHAPATGRYLQLLGFAAAPIAIWTWTRRFNWFGPLAAAAAAITPALFWQATTADDDLLLALAGFALAVAVYEALQPDFAPPDWLTGLLLGMLGGTGWSLKAHLIPLCTALPAVWVVAGRTPKVILRRASFAAAGLLITAAPPLVLRWIDTGNPLFPAYNNIFRSQYWLPVNEKLNFPFWTATGSWGPLSAIWKGVVDPSVMNEAAPPGSFAIPVLVATATLLVGWRYRRGRGLRLLWLALLVAVAAWWIEFRYLRYLLPSAFLAACLLLAGARASHPSLLARRLALPALVLAAPASFAVAVAMFWNVPNQNVPVSAAVGRWQASSYLAAAYPEREAILAFNRIAPPGAIYVTGGSLAAFERAWLTGGRDLYEDWELNEVLEIGSTSPSGGTQAFKRLRARGIGWALVNDADSTLSQFPWLTQLLTTHGQIRFSAHGWNLFQLVTKVAAPTPLAACDRPTRGIPRCWKGDFRSASGSTTPLARRVPVCPGEIIIVSVRQAGVGGPAPVLIQFPTAYPPDAVQTGITAPGTTAHVYATVPSGVSSADITINPASGSRIEQASVARQGSCTR